MSRSTTSTVTQSTPCSALEGVRSRQASLQPLLRFDAKGLARAGDPCMDSDDLASLWSAFTKCKEHLTDGVRLENLTWRLWHRESNLVLGRRPSVAADALSLRREPLSDPEVGNSSDDDGASLSSVDLDRNNSSLYFNRSDCGSSSRDTSPVSDVDQSGAGHRGANNLPPPVSGRRVKRDFLPLLPESLPSERMINGGGPKIAGPGLTPSNRRSAAGGRPSLPPLQLPSSQLLPPARPNAMTPSDLANIITTILPMDVASEQAKVRAESLILVTPDVVNLKVRRWTSPEHDAVKPLAGQVVGFTSAEATPVGTPIKSLMAPPRIVNIAPTPPPASPAVSRPSTPLTATEIDATSPCMIPGPSSEREMTASSPQQISPSPSPSDTVGGLSAGTPATSSSGGSSTKNGLRPALSKKGSHGRTVRISPTMPRGVAMERRASGGRGSVTFAKRNGSNANLGAGKGKGKAKAESPLMLRGGSAGSHVPSRGGSMSSGSLTRSERSPVQPPRMADATPVVLKPLRSVVGFADPAEVPEEAAETDISERSQPQPMPSPPVPATPVNSQASAPLTDAGQSSVASSLGAPLGFPDAPPPTPARYGAHLPTTMTAKSGAAAGEETAQNASKKPARAMFFIDTAQDTDDEGSLSPRSPRSMGNRRGRGAGKSVGSQRIMSPIKASPIFPMVPPPSLENERPPPPVSHPEPEPAAAPAPAVAEDDEDDYETESDSDEWGSDDSEEDEEAAEAERAAAQAAFQLELFKKHPVVPGNATNATGIRRAGLSMLFHPELRDTPAPNRNQSALELRRPMRSPPATRAPAPNRPARSLSNFPRPSSLLKSKSSVALPVLAHAEPEMKKISPGARSSMSRASTRPPSASGSGRSSQGTTSRPSTVRPGATRHPSRLGAQPENMEFSDDEEDDDEEVPSMEQAQRLAAVAARRIETRPEPIAPPLSPRTTRRNMLANEMTESVRRNLVWERKMRAAAMGVVPGRNFPPAQIGDDAEETSFFSQGYHASGW